MGMHAGIGYGATSDWVMPLAANRKVVAASGTAVQISTVTGSGVFLLQALHTNVGNIMIGNSAVLIASGSENGMELEPGQSLTLPVRDPSVWYMDADTANDGVSFLILG